MSHVKAGLEKAKEMGHTLGYDPPVFSSVNRHTCKTCGRAVLTNSEKAYGSALTTTCQEAQDENKKYENRR